MVQSIDAILKNLRSSTQVIDPWERIMEINHCYNSRNFCDTTGFIMHVHKYAESASFIKMLKGLNDKLVIGLSLTKSHVYRGTMVKALKGSNFWRLLHSNNLIFKTQ